MADTGKAKAQNRKTRIFLSYSRKDIEFAQLLKVELEKADYQPSLDKTDIAPGEAWQDRLGKLIQEADAIVFSVSPHSAASSICAWEINEAARLGKRIIPVVADAVDPSLLPDALTKLNFIFFDNQSFEDAFGKLREALDTDLDWVRQHTRLGEQALDWLARNKAKSQLLFGRSLADAETWSAKRPDSASPPTALQLEYIAASRRALTTRQRLGLFAAIAVAFVSFGFFVWGEFNRREAVVQRDKAQKIADAALQASETFSFDVVTSLRITSGVPLVVTQSVLQAVREMQTSLMQSGANDNSQRVSRVPTDLQFAKILQLQGNIQEAVENANIAVKNATDLKLYFDTHSPLNENDDRLKNINLLNLSASFTTLGDIQKNSQEDYANALKSYQAAVDALELAAVKPGEEQQRQANVATALGDIADAQFHLAQTKDEFKNIPLATGQKALDVYRVLLSEGTMLDDCGYPMTGKLDTENKVDYRSSQSNALDLVGRTYNALEQFGEGEKYFCEAVKAATDVSLARPDDMSVRQMLSGTHKAYGNNLQKQGGEKQAAATKEISTFSEIAKDLSDRNPGNASLLSDYAFSVLFKVSYVDADPQSIAQQYKLYVELMLKLGRANQSNEVALGNLAEAFDIFRGQNLRVEDSDGADMKVFVREMGALVTAGEAATIDNVQKALAAIAPQ